MSSSDRHDGRVPPPTSTRYHHGDLRRALLSAAAEEIAANGVAALSLRELARRAGVSHAAPAHHFKDKRGVFTALAAEGFALLHAMTTEVLVAEVDDALVRAGECYVEFALEHPAHFAVMFDAALLDYSDADLTRERDIAFDNLYQAVRRTTAAEEPELTMQVVAAWTVVHGMASLWLTGNLPYPRSRDQVSLAFRDLSPSLLRIAQAALGDR
jgi:AcrR family transcriptional regulator